MQGYRADGPKRELAVSKGIRATNLAKRRIKRPSKLLRRYSFQELSANAYALNIREMDMFGEPVLSPTHNFAFQCQLSVTPTSASQTDLKVDLSDVKL